MSTGTVGGLVYYSLIMQVWGIIRDEYELDSWVKGLAEYNVKVGCKNLVEGWDRYENRCEEQ